MHVISASPNNPFSHVFKNLLPSPPNPIGMKEMNAYSDLAWQSFQNHASFDLKYASYGLHWFTVLEIRHFHKSAILVYSQGLWQK